MFATGAMDGKKMQLSNHEQNTELQRDGKGLLFVITTVDVYTLYNVNLSREKSRSITNGF